jgi:hypothetical protein
MRRTLPILLLALPLGSCVLAAAAVVGAAVIGAVKYTENGLERDFTQDLATCFAAAKTAMKECGYAVPDEARPIPSDGELSVGDAKITLTRQPGATDSLDDDTTRAVVRVGTFDSDETKRKARLLMDALSRALGA